MTPLLKALLCEQVAVNLETNGLTPQRSILQRALAASFSGDVIQPAKFFAAMCVEVSRLGTIIFESMQKVLSSVQIQEDGDLAAELLQIFDLEFDPILAGIRVGFGANFAEISGGANAVDRLNTHAENIRRASKLKIRLLVEKIMKDELKRMATFTIENSQIGVLQAGETNSVINSTINLAAAEKESLRETMRAIADRLTQIESLTEVERTELREVALDAEAELAKPKPNGTKLRGFITAVLAGIRGIATLNDLYEVLKLALPALGVHVA